MNNILVVDDERSYRNSLKEMLEYEGYAVDLAESGIEALEKFESTGAEMLVTACPLCKKSFAKVSHIPVKDLSELVSESIKADI